MKFSRLAILLSFTAVLFLSAASCRQEKEADYVLEAAVLSGEYNGNIGNNGEHNYYIHLSDKGFSADGKSISNGNYYRFDIFAPGPVRPDIITIPTGRYVLGTKNATVCGTFTPELSSYFINGPCGSPETVLAFSHGTLDITCKDDIYTFEAMLTDISGMTHSVRYTGAQHLANRSGDTVPDYLPLQEDIEINCHTLAAVNYGPVNGFDNVIISMTDMTADSVSHVTPPGSILTLDCYMPVDEAGIIPGRYEISDLWGMKDYTLSPGEESNGQYVGSHVQLFKEDRSYLGFLSSGTVYIERIAANDSTVYSIETELVTSSGNTVVCLYEGTIGLTEAPSETAAAPGNTFSRPVFNPITRSHFILRSKL